MLVAMVCASAARARASRIRRPKYRPSASASRAQITHSGPPAATAGGVKSARRVPGTTKWLSHGAAPSDREDRKEGMAVTFRVCLRDLGDGTGRQPTASPPGVRRHHQSRRKSAAVRGRMPSPPGQSSADRNGTAMRGAMRGAFRFRAGPRKHIATHIKRR